MANSLPDDINEEELSQWIESSLKEHTHNLSSGLQGQTLLYKDSDPKLVVKVSHGKGLMLMLNKRMLKHEYDVYCKLAGFKAVPRCYGLIANKYLVLEYIDGQPIRNIRPKDEVSYFARLLDDIKQLHSYDIGHMDLKKRDNLLVTHDDQPCIIDFGAAVIYKPGFHPFNHLWLRIAKQFDYNAWFVHKYRDKPDSTIIEADRQFFKRTYTERLSRKIKRFYKDKLRYIFKLKN
ncbi:MAG: hypothetical protein OQK76_12460 [Gammaproteobacteria bacterium]|nr:hypothetical protein [Gammaproteobacteria bacterium]MCW8911418.1 hypothetical protein [Gammaproteobacteria bacterium]MCW9003991.1 hypothetical protein [Gammaproteobacteria bacterium]MCW9055699.1 hypothetical protein [Gammaproteobacteria bacterium]